MRSPLLVLIPCTVLFSFYFVIGINGDGNPSKRSVHDESISMRDGFADMAQGDQPRESNTRLQPRFAHLRPGPETANVDETEVEELDDVPRPGGRGTESRGRQVTSGKGGRTGNRHRHGHGRPVTDVEDTPTYNHTFAYGRYPDNDEEEEVEEEGEGGIRGCPRCESHEEYKRLRLEAIKAEILSRLNLKEPPKMSNKTLPQNPTISSLIDRFAKYEMPSDEPYDNGNDDNAPYRAHDSYHVKPLEVLHMASKPPANKTLNDTNVCYFALNPEILTAKKTRADFAVYIRKSRAPTTQTTLLNVYKLENRGQGIIRKLVYQQKLVLNDKATGKWYRWSVDRIVRSWIRNPDSNLGLEIDAFDFDGRPLAIVQTDNEADEPLKPYLEVQVKGSSRQKRNQPTPQCKTANKNKRCCRYPLIVDFVAMGWDWILAPKQYKAYYCYGKCPFAYYRPYPHTHIITQTEVNDFIPCCTPTELNSLLLFYRNEEQTIIYGTIPGMIVESCGCI